MNGSILKQTLAWIGGWCGVELMLFHCGRMKKTVVETGLQWINSPIFIILILVTMIQMDTRGKQIPFGAPVPDNWWLWTILFEPRVLSFTDWSTSYILAAKGDQPINAMSLALHHSLRNTSVVLVNNTGRPSSSKDGIVVRFFHSFSGTRFQNELSTVQLRIFSHPRIWRLGLALGFLKRKCLILYVVTVVFQLIFKNGKKLLIWHTKEEALALAHFTLNKSLIFGDNSIICSIVYFRDNALTTKIAIFVLCQNLILYWIRFIFFCQSALLLRK